MREADAYDGPVSPPVSLPLQVTLPVALFVSALATGQDTAAPGSSWWSHQPMVRHSPPAVKDGAWSHNEIDHFILARLEEAGLAPAPEASRATLIRRAFYDLTGLPPSAAEVATFVNDSSPGAWPRLIDRLLASPQYGEKWGRHWLDLVRYADTNGFERDSDKPAAWRYRDWVVAALNADKPYDRFLVEQLAGDELPDRTFDTMVATGYYRLGMWDDEVPDLKQALYDDLDGIVDVTARGMLGIGMGCARCHDHKGDPITQRDYYSFAAFFAGLRPYKSMPGNSIEAGNVMRSLAPEFGVRDLAAERAAYSRDRDALVHSLLALQSHAGLLAKEPAEGLVSHFPFETPADAPELDRSTVTSAVGTAIGEVADLGFGTPGHAGLCASFDGGDDAVSIDRPVCDDFTISFWLKTDRLAAGRDTDPRWFLGTGLVDGEVPGITDDFGISMIGNGIIAAGTGRPETFVSSGAGYNDGAWHHVALTRQRSSGLLRLVIDGMEVARATGGTQPLAASARLSLGVMATGHNPFTGHLDELRFYDRPLTDDELLQLATGVASPGAFLGISESSGPAAAVEWKAGRERLVSMAPASIHTEGVLCATAVPEPPPMHVLTRGSPHAPAEEVPVAVPAIFASLALESPTPAHGESSGRRTALARWIANPDNVRTARVAANRLWQHHFGQGLVPSTSDFGRFGDKPTHEELLDWLALRLIDEGWSLKAMHRLLMTSAAYQMDSVAAPGSKDRVLAIDMANDRLSRFRLRRLTAEELRDSMLAASGQLTLEGGGPGVRPPLPAEVLATSSRPNEVWPLTPPDTWGRRSLYMHQKRSLSDPLLAVFDQADIDNACPVRFNTVQPTQSLILFNGAFANDQARLLAERARRESPDTPVAALVRIAHGREPTPEELASADRFLHELSAERAVPPTDALSLLALTLINSNEFMHVD